MTLSFFSFQRYTTVMIKAHTYHAPLSPAARAAAGEALSRLRQGGGLFVEFKRNRLALPAELINDVQALLAAYADGGTPIVASSDEEVGTQEAADFLNLSRPTVVKLMDEGRIAFRKPGKHRRVRVADLVAFERDLRAQQDAATDELSALGQEAIRRAREKGNYSDEMI